MKILEKRLKILENVLEYTGISVLKLGGHPDKGKLNNLKNQLSVFDLEPPYYYGSTKLKSIVQNLVFLPSKSN